MANLAHALVERGVGVKILTAKWDDRWPDVLMHRSVEVIRLAHPSVRFLGTLRYMRAVRRWLRAYCDQYDLVYVSMLKHDAFAALGAVELRKTPVVLRAEGSGASGDVAWQRVDRFGGIIARRCRAASAFVAATETARDEMLSAGYPAERIRVIANGVSLPSERTTADQKAARRELAGAGPSRDATRGEPLIVYAGRLDVAKGLPELVAAWPIRSELARQIERLALGGRVTLAGRFDSVQEFLRAADVFVLPSHEEMMSMALLEAMAMGLPVVASDIPGNRRLVDSRKHGLLFPKGDLDAIAVSILLSLDEPAMASKWGLAARERVHREFSLSEMAERHIELFDSLSST